jgi:antitoxin YefM
MIAVKAIEFRDKFKGYCDIVTNGETIIISRTHSDIVVILSERDYNEMVKIRRNAEYLAKIDKSSKDIDNGKGIVKTLAELEAMAL